MARFQLLEKHYINVDNCEWEYKEERQGAVRGRNRQRRTVFPVPMYFDPKDPADCNYGSPDRIIISTREDPAFPDDYLCRGTFIPTLDMVPLDAEGEKLMADFRKNYKGEHPIESLSGSYGDALFERLSSQLESLMKINPTVPQSAAVSQGELDKLKAENAALHAKLDAVLTQLGLNPAPVPVAQRVGGL